MRARLGVVSFLDILSCYGSAVGTFGQGFGDKVRWGGLVYRRGDFLVVLDFLFCNPHSLSLTHTLSFSLFRSVVSVFDRKKTLSGIIVFSLARIS